MEVGVQTFFQEPRDLFDVPLLHILHKLLQVRLMEGDKGTGERMKRHLWLGDVRLVWLGMFNNAAKRWKPEVAAFSFFCVWRFYFCAVMPNKWTMYSRYCKLLQDGRRRVKERPVKQQGNEAACLSISGGRYYSLSSDVMLVILHSAWEQHFCILV